MAQAAPAGDRGEPSLHSHRSSAQCETQTELGVQQRPQRDPGTATSLLQGKDEAAGIVQPEESSGRLLSTLLI